MDVISGQFSIPFVLMVSPILAPGYSFLHMSILSDIQPSLCNAFYVTVGQGWIHCIRQNFYCFLICSMFSDWHSEGEAVQFYLAEGAKALFTLFWVQ